MTELKEDEKECLKMLFSSLQDSLIQSCIQNYFGRAWVDQKRNPTSGKIVVSDFAFLAGQPDIEILHCGMDGTKQHSQTLLPMIEQVVKMAGIELEELDAIAVAAGPGSFTGLRIGSSTAKGMALALKKPILSIPTLEGLAYRLTPVTDELVCPLMDARRNQVYTGIYQNKKEGIEAVRQQEAVAIEELIEQVNALERPVVFLGDGVPVQKEVLEANITVPYRFAPAHLNRQSASAVAALGVVYYKEGKSEDARDHKPIYLRQSQAERERALRLKGEQA